MVKRQRTAFPPNFVHSLDGSHMMMTAVACKRQGLYFAGWYFTICRIIYGILICVCVFYYQHLCIDAGVHDSYWTHAGDVDTMNKILREKFVELYDAPILENVCILPSQLFTLVLSIPFNTSYKPLCTVVVYCFISSLSARPILWAPVPCLTMSSQLFLCRSFPILCIQFVNTVYFMQLLESFETSFPKLKFPPLPERGDFDMKDVLRSTYFFNQYDLQWHIVPFSLCCPSAAFAQIWSSVELHDRLR